MTNSPPNSSTESWLKWLKEDEQELLTHIKKWGLKSQMRLDNIHVFSLIERLAKERMKNG